ncbi:MAG: subclass metallo-beta-lactamase [Pseudomonadota bacterium]
MSIRSILFAVLPLTTLMSPGTAAAASRPILNCPECASWSEPVTPFKIYGNTYYVGMKNIAAILVTSDFGHVLIDGGFPESAPLIAANIGKLGFKVTDVKAILLSHAHVDHAGGIAELQRLSGAPVYVRRPAADVLRTGKLQPDDPQAKSKSAPTPMVGEIWIVNDDQLLGVGSNRLRAIATPGHTPGGTTWTWDACEGDKCLAVVYADSLSPVASPGFAFSAPLASGQITAQQLQASIERIGKLRCDILVTVHPDTSRFLERVASRPANDLAAIKDDTQCKAYARAAQQRLAERLAQEGRGPGK